MRRAIFHVRFCSFLPSCPVCFVLRSGNGKRTDGETLICWEHVVHLFSYFGGCLYVASNFFERGCFFTMTYIHCTRVIMKVGLRSEYNQAELYG